MRREDEDPPYARAPRAFKPERLGRIHIERGQARGVMMRDLFRAAAVGTRSEYFRGHRQARPQERKNAAIRGNRKRFVIGFFQDFARRAGLGGGDFVEGFLSLVLSSEVNAFAVPGPNDFIHTAVKRFSQFDMFSAGTVV